LTSFLKHFESYFFFVDSPHVRSGNWKGLFSSGYYFYLYLCLICSNNLFELYKILALRAIATQNTDKQGNFDQQGGSLIIGPGQVLHFFHKDRTARDHMPINKLLKHVGAQQIDFEKERLRNTQVI